MAIDKKLIAELKIKKKLYCMAKPNVKEIVTWLRKTADEINKNYEEYSQATFRYYHYDK